MYIILCVGIDSCVDAEEDASSVGSDSAPSADNLDAEELKHCHERIRKQVKTKVITFTTNLIIYLQNYNYKYIYKHHKLVYLQSSQTYLFTLQN